jgi:metal-dependent amidase/aminoacylase/carboxypeptidase family protein
MEAVDDVIPADAVLPLNLRSYAEPTRQRMLDAIKRIVRGECQASGSPREDLPSNHSPKFPPPLQPTLRTGTGALTVAAMSWLAPD